MTCQLHIMRVKSYMHASFCCKHTSVRLHVQICQFVLDYTAMHIQYVQLALSKCSHFPLKRIRHTPKGMAMNYANINTLIRNHFPSSMQYEVGSSAQLCQSSPGPQPMQARMYHISCFYLCRIVPRNMAPRQS